MAPKSTANGIRIKRNGSPSRKPLKKADFSVEEGVDVS
jgi:hypothetical protein